MTTCFGISLYSSVIWCYFFGPNFHFWAALSRSRLPSSHVYTFRVKECTLHDYSVLFQQPFLLVLPDGRLFVAVDDEREVYIIKYLPSFLRSLEKSHGCHRQQNPEQYLTIFEVKPLLQDFHAVDPTSN